MHIMVGTETSETCIHVCSVCTVIPAGLVCGQRLHSYTCRTCLWAAFAQLYLQDLSVSSACTIPTGLVCRQRLHSYTCRTCLWGNACTIPAGLSVGSACTIIFAGRSCGQRLPNACRTCLGEALGQYLQDLSVYLQDLSVDSIFTIIPAGLVCGKRLHKACKTFLWATLA